MRRTSKRLQCIKAKYVRFDHYIWHFCHFIKKVKSLASYTLQAALDNTKRIAETRDRVCSVLRAGYF